MIATTKQKRRPPHDHLATADARHVADMLRRADQLRHDIRKLVERDDVEDVLLGLMTRSSLDDIDARPLYVESVIDAMASLAFNIAAFRAMVSADLASGPWFDDTECRD